MRKLVQKKARGGKIEVPEEEERPSNVINLMDALRQSVQGKRGNTHARRRQTAKKRRAASRHKKAA